MQTGKAVADLKPLHPASSKIGDVVDNWYCRECCASFEQEGTYTCTEDQEALHVVERSLVMFQESTSEPRSIQITVAIMAYILGQSQHMMTYRDHMQSRTTMATVKTYKPRAVTRA